MRSGRKLSALQAENNFREPQEAERQRGDRRGSVGQNPLQRATEKEVT